MTTGRTHPSATDRQPPSAERARTVAARSTATLFAAGLGHVALRAATTTAAGDVLVVVPTDSALVTGLRDSPVGDLPARLTVTDRTPFPLRHPVRACVQLSGWLTPVAAADEQRLVLAFAEAAPEECLFDVGLGATLLRLDVAEVLLEESGTTAEIGPEAFAAARPDPVSLDETKLMTAACDGLGRLTARVQRWAGRHDDVRLLGLDRFGVRFRVQSRSGCYDLRVPFAAPLSAPADLDAALDHLLSCGPT